MVEKKTPVGKPADDFIRIQDLWSMWFNSKQREEPYLVLTSF